MYIRIKEESTFLYIHMCKYLSSEIPQFKKKKEKIACLLLG